MWVLLLIAEHRLTCSPTPHVTWLHAPRPINCWPPLSMLSEAAISDGVIWPKSSPLVFLVTLLVFGLIQIQPSLHLCFTIFVRPLSHTPLCLLCHYYFSCENYCYYCKQASYCDVVHGSFLVSVFPSVFLPFTVFYLIPPSAFA